MRTDQTETSSNGTTLKVTPSVSSSASCAPCSMAPLSPVSTDCDLKSPTSMHDSTISRLIDAVSLGHERDTCGSISALIGQCESIVDQDDFTLLHIQSPSHSNLRPNSLKAMDDLRSPTIKNAQVCRSPPTAVHKANYVNHGIISPYKSSQTEAALFYSPETAELEEVYTILDEEMLSPMSGYNMKKQTVQNEADILKNTPLESLSFSPAQASKGLGHGHIGGWDDPHSKWCRSEDVKEEEERVYEQVDDPPAPKPVQRCDSYQRYMCSSGNKDCSQLYNEPMGNALTEVEINVDEVPVGMMLTSTRHDNTWEELTSPTKRHTIYQNSESTPKYTPQKHTYRLSQQRLPSHIANVTFSPCPSPLNHTHTQLSNHQPQSSHPSDPSPFHRPLDSKHVKHSPLRQNSYPTTRSNPIAVHDNFNISYAQRNYSYITDESYQNRLGHKQMEREQESCFQNGFPSSVRFPEQPSESTNTSKRRDPCSPYSDFDEVYSQSQSNGITTSSETTAPQKARLPSQTVSYTQGPVRDQTQTTSLINIMHQSQPESKLSLHSKEGPLSICHKSSTTEPTPCKSKSLGDLTSEDISCNFKSKYNIICRSFITPHMRRQKGTGTRGEVMSQSQPCDPLTEQLRKLVSLEGDDIERERPQSLQLHHEVESPQTTSMAPIFSRDIDDSPPPLTRRLSSRSQSRVRHINSRARERQQESLKSRAGVMVSSTTTSIGGVVLRNKPASQNAPANRHSTGSYIAGYLGHLEDRGLPEGACTSLRYGNGDNHGDRYSTNDALSSTESSHFVSEPEVYFLLRL